MQCSRLGRLLIQEKCSCAEKTTAQLREVSTACCSSSRVRLTLLLVRRNLFWQLSKRRKLARFGYVTCHDNLPQTILQGNLVGGRRRGRQRKRWMDNIKERTYLPMPEQLTRVSCRKDWERISASSPLLSSAYHPTRRTCDTKARL